MLFLIAIIVIILVSLGFSLFVLVSTFETYDALPSSPSPPPLFPCKGKVVEKCVTPDWPPSMRQATESECGGVDGGKLNEDDKDGKAMPCHWKPQGMGPICGYNADDPAVHVYPIAVAPVAADAAHIRIVFFTSNSTKRRMSY